MGGPQGAVCAHGGAAGARSGGRGPWVQQVTLVGWAGSWCLVIGASRLHLLLITTCSVWSTPPLVDCTGPLNLHAPSPQSSHLPPAQPTRACMISWSSLSLWLRRRASSTGCRCSGEVAAWLGAAGRRGAARELIESSAAIEAVRTRMLIVL